MSNQPASQRLSEHACSDNDETNGRLISIESGWPLELESFESDGKYFAGCRALCWILVATVSFVTTKSLLDSEFHYPMHLLALYTSGALIVRFAQWVVSRRSSELSWHSGPQQSSLVEQNARQQKRWRILFAICAAGFLVCAYQTILHWRNLPVVVVVLSQLVGVEHAKETTCSFIWSLATRTAQAIGLAMIVAFDFRLSLVGIILLMASFAFGILAQHSLREIHEREPSKQDQPARMSPTVHTFSRCVEQADLQTLALAASLGVALFWCHFREQQFSSRVRVYSPWTSGKGDLAIFVVNLLSSISILGHELSARSGQAADDTNERRRELPSLWDASRTLLLVGLTTFANMWLSELAANISPLQWIGFGLVLTAGLLQRTKIMVDCHAAEDEKRQALNLDVIGGLTVCRLRGHKSREENVLVRLCSIERLLVIVLVAAIWIAFAGCAHLRKGRPSQSTELQLKTISGPPGKFEIVIARYDEPASHVAKHIFEVLPTVHQLNPTIRVYDKKERSEDTTNFFFQLSGILSRNLEQPINLSVEKLNNVGRETDVYLHHITTHYNSLANHTLFMQAHPHSGPVAHTQRIQDYFVPQTGFLSLGKQDGYCSSCDHCHDRDWYEQPALLQELYADFNGGHDCKDIVLTYRGQFIASAARIRSNPVSTYEKWLEELRDPEGRLHTAPYASSVWSRKNDSMASPRVGFTFERMWGSMMRCNEKRIAERCPSMLSGVLDPARAWKDVVLGDCQCLDL